MDETSRSTSRHWPTWAALTLSCFALIATSPARPATRTAETEAAGAAGEILPFEVFLTDDAVDEATSLTVAVRVESAATTLDEATLRLVPHDPSLAVVEGQLAPAGTPEVLEGEVTLGALGACTEDANCRLGFSVEVVPATAYAATLMATLTNENSGCGLSDASFSSEATVEVSTIQ